MMYGTHPTRETIADIAAFVRSARREVLKAESRLLQNSSWRRERMYRVMTRPDFVTARMHLDRARHVLTGLERHLCSLEAEMMEEQLQAALELAEEPAWFWDPLEEVKVEERLSQREYDV